MVLPVIKYSDCLAFIIPHFNFVYYLSSPFLHLFLIFFFLYFVAISVCSY